MGGPARAAPRRQGRECGSSAPIDRQYHICYYSSVDYTIAYYSESVQEQILDLPDALAARYVVLTRRMISLGPNLGEPHTKAFGDEGD